MKLFNKFLCVLMVIFIHNFFIISGNVFAQRAIPDNNLSYPVLIKFSKSNGSGFFFNYNNAFYLVTARHVLYSDSCIDFELTDSKNKILSKIPTEFRRKIYYEKDTKKMYFFGTMTGIEKEGLISNIPSSEKNLIKKINELYDASQILKLSNNYGLLMSYPSDLNENIIQKIFVDFRILDKEGAIYYNKSKDVAAVKIADVKKIEEASGYKLSYNKKAIKTFQNTKSGLISLGQDSFKQFSDVLVGNEVYMFGYPTSLSINPEIDVEKPLLRKGIIAGKNEKFKTIILDCPVYFGNSGGIVIEIENVNLGQKKYLAIGIVSKYVPFMKGWKENSGYSIAEPMDGLIEIIPKDK